jgi:hypothetical protein
VSKVLRDIKTKLTIVKNKQYTIVIPKYKIRQVDGPNKKFKVTKQSSLLLVTHFTYDIK